MNIIILIFNEDTTFDKTDFRNTVPRFNPENRKVNQAMVDLLAQVAERKNATQVQISLAWLLAQKPWYLPGRIDDIIGICR